jgi:hypothetical protein
VSDEGGGKIVGVADPRAKPVFAVKLVGDAHVGRSALAEALMDFPIATDEDIARLAVVEGDTEMSALDAIVWVVRGEPDDGARASVDALRAQAKAVYVAVHARDAADAKKDDDAHAAWAALVGPEHVYLTATPPEHAARGVDELRAALLQQALAGVGVSIDRARLAKRPYATSIVAGAALVSAAEGLLPGAAAFVLATQVGAITSLYYLYTGKWMGRTQVLSLLPVFASEAAGGSAFLIVKSFLPPTGVADVVAAGVASSMTIAMLGAVTWALEQGYELDQKQQLKLAFRRLQAKTKAERAVIARSKDRWKDKAFWTDLVRRLIFE